MPIKIALILSVLIQFVAAIIAISLIKRTRYNISWVLISAGFFLMAIRRLIELFQVFDLESLIINGLLSSWTAVFISVIMLFGLIYIKRIFDMQKRIEDLRKENESRILSAIIKTEENERQRFAKELHDGLGPLLASVKMAISAISKSKNKKAGDEIIENTDKLIDESITTIKEISNNLSPHILNNFGLLKAVRSFVSKLPVTDDLQITVNGNTENRRFEYNVEVILYRVICELITNTIRHASATKANIDLYLEDNLLTVEFHDNGEGFDVEEVLNMQKGMGYANMQSRIKSLNGSFNIFSSPDQGVNITITVKID
jgi:signal transduction histidine kinase